MQKKSFGDCSLAYLEKTFGLIPQFECPQLDAWIAMETPIDEEEQRELLKFQQLLKLNILHWNEQELSLNFIGPMFAMVQFTSLQLNFFAQRSISGVVQEIELYGKPDGIVASGFRAPEIPYFAFHEFKKEVDTVGDPAGQALAAMLVGQALNEDKEQAIYGCYVNGRSWNFMLLSNNTYCISQDFSAASTEIFDLFRILKSLKIMIQALVNPIGNR